MRLSPTRVEQTLSQFEAQVIPDSHPLIPKFKDLWGDHTYFLAVNGLNIVEPLDPRAADVQAAMVVNLASWAADGGNSLAPHQPEATEIVVEFDPEDEAGEAPVLLH